MLFIAENEQENELVQRLAREYGGTAYKRENAYGVTVWSVTDVLQEHPELTEDDAAEFLESYERKLAESSIAGGWDFIENADCCIPDKPIDITGQIKLLQSQAESIGGKLNISEDSFIDARHLNCFWYDSGSFATFEYKGFMCSFEVQGDIRLGVLDEALENEILAFGKRNGQPAHKDDGVLAVIRDDKGLQALSKQGRLCWSLNNWVEFRVFDEHDNEIALHEDNVLEDNLLEATDGLSFFADIIDEVIQKRNQTKEPISLDNKIQEAEERSATSSRDDGSGELGFNR